MTSETFLRATEEPRRFTRGRLSRGKGLRKTTGCLTCRRRHVKCDEVKPRCGGCIRNKTRCEYAKSQDGNKRPRQQCDLGNFIPGSSHRDVNEQAEEGIFQSTETASPPYLGQPIQTSEAEQHGTTMASQEGDMTLRDQLNDALPQCHTTNSSEGDETDQYISPAITESPRTNLGSAVNYGTSDFHQFQSMVYGIPSPNQVPFQSMSIPFETTSDSGNSYSISLTSKWLDLLIGDATLNYGPLPEARFELEGTNIFGNSVAQTPITSHSGDNRPRRLRAHMEGGRVQTHNAYLLERVKDHSQEKNNVWQALEPINLQMQERVLFRHFIDHISRWLDLFEPQRPFGTLVPHLALHNVGLMNAILALSARHLDIINKETPTYAAGFRPGPKDTIGYYYKTLHYCQEAMQYDNYKTSLELLSSAVIISSYEMLNGPNTDWEKHLKGVFWIQRSQLIHGHSGGLRQAVWWAWLCQDIWASFREKRKPFTFWRPGRPLAGLNPSELAARAVYNFAHVVGFCAKDEAPKGSDYIAIKSHEADLLSQQLEQWVSYLTLEFNPLPIVATDAEDNPFPHVWIQPQSFAVSMQIYYCSLILLQLHRPCSGGYEEYLEKQRTLKLWAGTICGIAKTSCDYASSILSSQCVFIAGMVIEDRKQRSAILELLDKCCQQTGWPRYSLAHELQEVWGD